MDFSKTEVDKVAHLARINLTEDESMSFAGELSKILDLVAHINEADTDKITPMAHPLETMIQRLREDDVSEQDNREEFQAIAPQVESGLYLVPKVIED